MLLYVIVLLEGFVTISLEILTLRQLIPLVGNSIIVTSLIIGVFLLFLAYGYRKGGLYQESYSAILTKNFIWAAFGFGIGLSYLFIEYFFYLFRIFNPHSTLLPLTLYLLLIIAPIVYLLGQTVPITLNMWKNHKSIGETGGQVLHISTIGSFLGATLTALLLLNYLGVAWSIVIDFCILLGIALLLMDVKTKFLQFISIIVFGAVISWCNIALERVLFITTNNYANYQVIKDPKSDTGKILIINDSFSSHINNKLQGFPYIELIKKILFQDLKLTNKHILILGAGGFTLSADPTKGNHFVYVDIDEKLKPLVKEHFLSHINGEVIVDDARHYLNTTTQRYDVIVGDAFSNAITIAPHLLTQEYFYALRHALVDDGIAVFNFIMRPTLNDAYSKHIDNTVRSVFSNCMSIPIEYVDQLTNVIYVCKSSSYHSDRHKYTDNLNHSALDFFNRKA